MEFISFLQTDECMTALTAVLVIALLLLGPYIVSGLATALKMLKGQLETEIISGRPGPLGELAWFAVSKYGCEYKKVMMELDGFDQPVIFKKFRVGPKLKRDKAFKPGDRYIMLVHKKKKGSFDKVDLLAISNGREVYVSPKDIFMLYGLDWGQILFLALIGFLVGLRFVAPLLSSWGNDIGALVVALICGLMPATALFILFHRAAANFRLQAQERLTDFARTWNPEGGGRPPWATALSLPVDNNYAWLAVGGICILVQPLLYMLAFILASANMIYNTISAFTRSSFEFRSLQLESFDEIRKDSSHKIYLKNAVMRDPVSGTAKKIKKFFPGDYLFNRGPINPGVTGLWMIREGKLGPPAMEETKNSLHVLAFFDVDQDLAAVSNPNDVLPLYTFPLYKAPLHAGLIGACVIISASITLTGDWPAPAEYLWLIPWAVVFTYLKHMETRRINFAILECFRNHATLQNIPNFPGVGTQRLYDSQTL